MRRSTLIVSLPLLALLGGCGGSTAQAHSDAVETARCRVTVQFEVAGSGTAMVAGNRSDVEQGLNSSTAELAGTEVVVKGWLGDVTVGRVEEGRVFVSAGGNNLSFGPIRDGGIDFEHEGLFGTSRHHFQGAGCIDRELALGAVHLMALIGRPRNTRR
jgi:hypothetical protein